MPNLLPTYRLKTCSLLATFWRQDLHDPLTPVPITPGSWVRTCLSQCATLQHLQQGQPHAPHLAGLDLYLDLDWRWR